MEFKWILSLNCETIDLTQYEEDLTIVKEFVGFTLLIDDFQHER